MQDVNLLTKLGAASFAHQGIGWDEILYISLPAILVLVGLAALVNRRINNMKNADSFGENSVEENVAEENIRDENLGNIIENNGSQISNTSDTPLNSPAAPLSPAPTSPAPPSSALEFSKLSELRSKSLCPL